MSFDAGLRLNRSFAAIQLDHTTEVAPGNAKVQRIQRDHCIAQHHVDAQIFQGQCLCPANCFGPQVHFGVQGVPARGVERQIWQHPHTSRCFRWLCNRICVLVRRRRTAFNRSLFCSLTRCFDAACARSDQGAEVVNVQQIGGQIGDHHRSLPSERNFGRSGDVALAKFAGEILVTPLVSCTLESPIQRIRPGARRCDSNQRKQLVEVVTTQSQLHVQCRQRQKACHGAFTGNFSASELGFYFQWIGCRFVAQGNDGAAAAFG